MSNISKLKNKLWDFCLSETFCEFVFCLFAEIVQTTTNSNMFLKKNNWNIFQPERLPDLKNKILWGVWLTSPSEMCSIVLKKNLWVDEQDGGGFDPFINLARNKTSFSLRLTCRTRRQRLRMEWEEGEAGRGGEGRPVFIVLPRRNWAFCLRRDLLHHETAKTYWEQKEETPLCLSLHRSPPSSFSRRPFREKLSTFIFSLLYPSSVCKPLEYSARPRINVDDVHLFKHWFSFMFWSRLGRDYGLSLNVPMNKITRRSVLWLDCSVFSSSEAATLQTSASEEGFREFCRKTFIFFSLSSSTWHRAFLPAGEASHVRSPSVEFSQTLSCLSSFPSLLSLFLCRILFNSCVYMDPNVPLITGKIWMKMPH